MVSRDGRPKRGARCTMVITIGSEGGFDAAPTSKLKLSANRTVSHRAGLCLRNAFAQRET